MQLLSAKPGDVNELVRISKAAFDSDGRTGGPPEYDNLQWHVEMAAQEHLFTAVENGRIVGGAVLFRDNGSPWHLYVGRIFIDPELFRMGYGRKLMKAVEGVYDGVSVISLDTPVWNNRTNAFYKVIGYTEIRRDDDFVYYQTHL